MLDKEQMERSVAMIVAGEVVKSLDSTTKNDLIERALADALKGYKFRDAIEKAVAAEAGRIAERLVGQTCWQERIEMAVAAGFHHYEKALPAAVAQGFQDMMHGTDGSYGRSSLLLSKLKPLPLPEDAKED